MPAVDPKRPFQSGRPVSLKRIEVLRDRFPRYLAGCVNRECRREPMRLMQRAGIENAQVWSRSRYGVQSRSAVRAKVTINAKTMVACVPIILCVARNADLIHAKSDKRRPT